jgi:putative transposase
MKTYTIRLFPNKEQIDSINELSLIRNQLWNDLIDIQNESYENDEKIRHNYDLDKEITKLRKTTDLGKLNSKACQRISKEIYSSYQSFFRLIKKDKNARPPRKIENINNFHTIVFNQSGWVVNSHNEIKINKIKLRYKSHLDLTNLNIKEIRLKYVNNKWLCDVCVDEIIEYKDKMDQENKVLGIDLGLKRLGTGVDNKGNEVVITNKSKKISKYYQKQINKLNSKISKKEKGSIKYKKLSKTRKKLYNKKNRQIKQTLHAQSKQLLSMNYHTIVIGKLTVKKLMENKNNKFKKISKSFHQSNINMFIDMLKYKSYKYQTNLVEIDERHTTQTNSLTGKLFKEKIELDNRTVKLKEGIEIDRDLNSAINILNRYFNNHLASMTEPLDLSSVIHKFNLTNKSLNEKPNLL